MEQIEAFLEFVLENEEEYDLAYHAGDGGWENFFQVDFVQRLRNITPKPKVEREVGGNNKLKVDYKIAKKTGVRPNYYIEVKVENKRHQKNHRRLEDLVLKDVEKLANFKFKNQEKEDRRFVLVLVKSERVLKKIRETLQKKKPSYPRIEKKGTYFVAVLIDLKEEEDGKHSKEISGGFHPEKEEASCAPTKGVVDLARYFDMQRFLEGIVDYGEFSNSISLALEDQKPWEGFAQVLIARRLQCDVLTQSSTNIREVQYPQTVRYRGGSKSSAELADFHFTLSEQPFVVELKVDVGGKFYSGKNRWPLADALKGESRKLMGWKQDDNDSLRRWLVIIMKKNDDYCKEILKFIFQDENYDVENACAKLLQPKRGRNCYKTEVGRRIQRRRQPPRNVKEEEMVNREDFRTDATVCKSKNNNNKHILVGLELFPINTPDRAESSGYDNPSSQSTRKRNRR